MEIFTALIKKGCKYLILWEYNRGMPGDRGVVLDMIPMHYQYAHYVEPIEQVSPTSPARSLLGIYIASGSRYAN